MNFKAQLITFLSSTIAKLIIWKYHPIVVAVTGNVGKSSTKEAISLVLSKKYTVRKNELNYNTPIGVALTIIGVDQKGSSSALIWLKHLLIGLKLLIKRSKKYPQVLILEYGADRPNDIKKLCNIARPDIAVVTSIGNIPVHIQFFPDIDSVYNEKSTIVKMLKRKGTAVLNYDNEKIYNFRKLTKENIISYGFSEGSDVHISSYKINCKEDLLDSSMYMRFDYKNHFAPFEITGALGRGFAYSFLCAVSVGMVLDINLVDSLHSLEDYQLLPSRLNLIHGIKNSFILNDCYNASPIAVENALNVLSDFDSNRKVFVFGDMRELGLYSEKAHRMVAKQIIDSNIKVFVGIGENVKFSIDSLEKLGFDKNNIFHYDNSNDARLKIQDLIYPGDLILIKGSHGVHLEIIAKEIAFDPSSIV